MRNKTKKTVLIVACVALCLGLLTSCVGLSALGFDFKKLDTSKMQTREYEAVEEFTAISVDVRTADLTLLPAQDNKTKVVCVEEEKTPHSVLVKDGVLTIEVEDNRKWYDHIGVYFESQKITMYLPKSEYAKITVEMDTGDICVAKEFSFAQAKITTHTGDVVWSAGVSEILEIETNTGDIEVGSVVCEAKLALKSDTGDMEIFDITCKALSIETDTGDVELGNSTTGELSIKTDTGDVGLENVVANALNVETNTGDVDLRDSDAGTIKIVTDTGDVCGVLLSEKIFFTDTNTGKVDVPKTTSGGVCDVRTKTGDIKFSIK